jgi:hypothetical protein
VEEKGCGFLRSSSRETERRGRIHGRRRRRDAGEGMEQRASANGTSKVERSAREPDSARKNFFAHRGDRASDRALARRGQRSSHGREVPAPWGSSAHA